MPAEQTRRPPASCGAFGRARRIAVFRALQLGDLLCTVPALRALRQAFPSSEITLVGLPWARTLIERFPGYLDDFMEFPGYPGLPERDCDIARLPAFLRDIQARRFDLALQLHGSGLLTNPLVVAFGAQRSAGFFKPGEHCPDVERFLPWDEQEHEVLRYLRLLAALGVPTQGHDLQFPLRAPDFAEIDALDPTGRLRDRDYVCVHPGSQLASRRWFPERFARVADALADRGMRIVLTGTAAEARLTAAVAERMRTSALDAAGRTSLGGVAALIDGARLLVANDTGVTHIAAARKTPSVVVSCGGDVRRWAPLDTVLHRVLHHDVECRPCRYAQCPLGHPCAAGVTAEAVIDVAAAAFVDGKRDARRGACVA